MRNIGIEVKKVKTVEGDQFDPFTSPLSVRGQQIVGTVISTKGARTATIVIERQIKVEKYQRFIKRRSKIQVHNPDSINAQDGDVVRVIATRPLSKTKHHVIIEIVKKAGEAASAETGSVAVNVREYKEATQAQHMKPKVKPKVEEQPKKVSEKDESN